MLDSWQCALYLALPGEVWPVLAIARNRDLWDDPGHHAGHSGVSHLQRPYFCPLQGTVLPFSCAINYIYMLMKDMFTAGNCSLSLPGSQFKIDFYFFFFFLKTDKGHHHFSHCCNWILTSRNCLSFSERQYKRIFYFDSVHDDMTNVLSFISHLSDLFPFHF